jgi:PHP family Zn ribbon phosphoesterase
VTYEYNKLVHHFESEFHCLLEAPYEELLKITNPQIAYSICAVREGKVDISPGYDGVYGKITVRKEEKKEKKQLSLF